jgi:hypothetical protein
MRFLLLTTFTISLTVLAVPASTTTKVIWTGSSGGITLEWNEQEIKFKTRADGPWQNIVQAGLGTDQTLEPGCSLKDSIRLVSVFGNYVTYERNSQLTCSDGRPKSERHYITVEATHPDQHLSLADLVTKESVYNALVKEPTIARALKANPPKKLPTELNEFVQYLVDATSNPYAKTPLKLDAQGCTGVSANLISEFAFYTAEKDEAVTKLALQSKLGLCRGMPADLTISLALPDRFRSVLSQAARRQSGFLMSEVAKISKGKWSVATIPASEDTPQ